MSFRSLESVARSGSDSRPLKEADDQGQQGPDDRRQDAGAGVVGVATTKQAAEGGDQHRQHLASETAARDAVHNAEDSAADAVHDVTNAVRGTSTPNEEGGRGRARNPGVSHRTPR